MRLIYSIIVFVVVSCKIANYKNIEMYSNCVHDRVKSSKLDNFEKYLIDKNIDLGLKNISDSIIAEYKFDLSYNINFDSCYLKFSRKSQLDSLNQFIDNKCFSEGFKLSHKMIQTLEKDSLSLKGLKLIRLHCLYSSFLLKDIMNMKKISLLIYTDSILIEGKKTSLLNFKKDFELIHQKKKNDLKKYNLNDELYFSISVIIKNENNMNNYDEILMIIKEIDRKMYYNF